MLNSGHVIQRQTGLTLNSAADATPYELNQSEYADFHDVTVQITSPSSLVGGILRLEEFDPLLNAWQPSAQKVVLQASGGGTPGVVNGNTASATAVVGGVTENCTGITAISNTATVNIQAPGNGKRKRLFTDATSGTATLGYSYVGHRSRLS